MAVDIVVSTVLRLAMSVAAQNDTDVELPVPAVASIETTDGADCGQAGEFVRIRFTQ